jgi:hypothetical protein
MDEKDVTVIWRQCIFCEKIVLMTILLDFPICDECIKKKIEAMNDRKEFRF